MSELAVGSLAGLAANSYVIDVASGSQLTQPGMVLQVVSTTKTDVFSSTSTSFADITGLSVSITPSSTSSKILVLVDIASSHSVASGSAYINLLRDSTDIAQGTGGATLNQTFFFANSQTYEVAHPSTSFLDVPSSTSSLTYKCQVKVASGTVYLNRAGHTANLGFVSSITAMEIAG